MTSRDAAKDEQKNEATPLLSDEEEAEQQTTESDKPLVDRKPSKVITKGRKSSSLRESIQDFLKRPQKPCCLLLFDAIATLAIFANICLLATQVIPLFIYPIETIGYLSIALRIYISVLCFIFILVEWNAPLPFLRDSLILQTYFSRGFIYGFVGLVGMEEAFSVMINDKLARGVGAFSVSWAPLFMQISSWLIVAIGSIYCVLGILCMQSLRKKMESNYQERLEDYERVNVV